MIDLFEPIAAACALGIPADLHKPVAIVGAGAIVEVGHLPAYRQHDVPVTGLTDIDGARARTLADAFAIDRVYADLDELLADETVSVVDVAVPTESGLAVVERALDAGKHVLSQKPFALHQRDAKALVDQAERAGLQIAVNQQLRFDEGIAAAKAMIDRGWIGDTLSVRFDINLKTDWSAWGWLVKSDRLDLSYHSIHYVDAVRYFLGDPDAVFCRATRTPGQLATGETRTTSMLIYPGDQQATIHTNHENNGHDIAATFRIEGTAGVIRATLGLLDNYPDGGPDTLQIRSDVLPTDGWLSYPVTTRWLPDAMIGPLASLLGSIAAGGSASITSGADNLRTVATIDALYASAASGQVEKVTLL